MRGLKRTALMQEYRFFKYEAAREYKAFVEFQFLFFTCLLFSLQEFILYSTQNFKNNLWVWVFQLLCSHLYKPLAWFSWVLRTHNSDWSQRVFWVLSTPMEVWSFGPQGHKCFQSQYKPPFDVKDSCMPGLRAVNCLTYARINDSNT